MGKRGKRSDKYDAEFASKAMQFEKGQVAEHEDLRQVPFEHGKSRLGIDVGGVLSVADTDVQVGGHQRRRRRTILKPDSPHQPTEEADVHEEGSGTSDEEPSGVASETLMVSMQRRPPTDRCVSVVAGLVRKFGPENVFIVSKCGPDVQRATIIWLHRWNFFGETGLRSENVCFCENRTGIEGHTMTLKWSPVTPPEGCKLESIRTVAGCEKLSIEQVHGFFNGPRVATAAQPFSGSRGRVGKGAIAAELGLSHFIDDRVECLHSVFFEGWLATPEAGGLEAAPEQAAMVCFGADAEVLKEKAIQDNDLQRLLTVSKVGAKAAKPISKAIGPTPEELWKEMADTQRSMWPRLETLRVNVPKNPRGKPSAEELELLKRHKMEEKVLKDELGSETWSVLIAYEKALARPAPKSSATAMVLDDPRMDEAQAPSPVNIEAQTRSNWTCPEAALFWSQRVATNHTSIDWDCVARLFKVNDS